MIVGVLTGESVGEYYARSRNAPLTLMQPPVIYLSRPDEEVDAGLVKHLSEEQPDLAFQPVMFRNL